VFRIEADRARFREIVRGRIREDLKKYLSTAELIARQGQHAVSVPVPQIDLPQFCFGANDKGGVGQGPGQKGDEVADDGSGQEGAGGAGEAEGRHILEVEVELDELAEMLGRELELPNIQPRGKRELLSEGGRYSGISAAGPDALRHFRRSYRQALRRTIAAGEWDEKNPRVLPIRDDFRYRARRATPTPESSAVVIHMMDVSGSMGREQKEIVRIEAFWIDTWLRRNYDGIESRYIVHDVQAKEVDRQTFFSVREDGGTRISSALQCARTLLDEHYDPADWNIYLFHFSDGDNSSEADNKLCVELLSGKLLPTCNMFGYCQVASAYGSGNFINVLHEAFPGCGTDKKPASDAGGASEDGRGALDARLVTSRVNSKTDIHDSLRTFFAAGR